MNLSIPTLCGIYNGTIRFWNHAVLQDMNPGHQLPDKEITVIARSDKSGTTHSFTSALAASCPVWEAEYGVFSHGLDENGMPIKWNKSAVHFFGYGNRGMSGLLLSLPYSIGYASVADIFVSKLKYARIQNNAGTFVEASTETVQNAMLELLSKPAQKLSKTQYWTPVIDIVYLTPWERIHILSQHTRSSSLRKPKRQDVNLLLN